MATLSGVQSSRGVFDRLRTAAGLDVLTVEGNTDGKGGGKSGADGTSLKAGKYVSENVFVTVGQGKEPGSSKVGVEIEVTRNISVDTHLGGDAQGNVGISWKWDY
jgi:translocation and assembly module TamB